MGSLGIAGGCQAGGIAAGAFMSGTSMGLARYQLSIAIAASRFDQSSSSAARSSGSIFGFSGVSPKALSRTPASPNCSTSASLAGSRKVRKYWLAWRCWRLV